MKVLARWALLLGLAAAVFFVAHEGVAAIIGVLTHAGARLVVLLPLHLIPLGLDAMGWKLQIQAPVKLTVLLRIAAIREAINRLLPVANVGGELAGIHLLTRSGVPEVVAAASVVIEVILTLVAQIAFIALGLLVFVEVNAHLKQSAAVWWGLAMMVPVPVICFWLLRRGVAFRGLRWMVGRIQRGPRDRPGLFEGWQSLDALIQRLTRAPGRLLATVGWQWLGLVAGCVETWLAMRLLGHPISAAAALVMDSLTLAIRSIAFVIPAGLGVQEAGMIGVGQLLGIGGEVAVALSLVKRIREVFFGIAALGLWQWTEPRTRSLADPLC